jgi:hypothetical protein
MIFLSYAREDHERAEKIYSMINKLDRPVFYDKESLFPGMDWREKIEKTLETCKLVLILCSRHTEEKEGYFQKEIRYALERSEMMPEGRIFIMPIRFDEATIPRKMARYQWLDIKNDFDFFSIEGYVEIAWQQIIKQEPPESIAAQLKEEIVMLLQGKNTDGKRTFAYIKLSVFKLGVLKNAIIQKQDFQPSDFGKVLVSGEGEPSQEIRELMTQQYGLMSTPVNEELELQKKLELQREQEKVKEALERYLVGYKEAYCAVLRTEADLSSVQIPDNIKKAYYEVFGTEADLSSAQIPDDLRLGIQAGVTAALGSLLDQGLIQFNDT